jgi:Protein of unknown function (DUF3761)
MRRIFTAAALLSCLVVPAFAQDVPAAPAPATPAATTDKPLAAVPATPPEGATALCTDGTYTSTHHASGICASHKGMAKMLKVH